jgi:Cysteine dioxygenase type I
VHGRGRRALAGPGAFITAPVPLGRKDDRVRALGYLPAGAFQVIDGVLEETSTTLRKRRLRRRLLKSGQGKSFGPEYVHSIVNPETAPATSIHAYSPPLTSMRFYSHSPSGLIVSQVVTNWDGAPPD